MSLIISFVFLYLTGDTLNLMSLGGLAVAIGLIIDDTVVVIENIARHLAEGQTGDAAVDRASEEISGAVIGSTLDHDPRLRAAGVRPRRGRSVLPIAERWRSTVALLVSMVVSLTIIPVLAARFLGRRPMPTTGPIYNLLADRYEGLLKVGLRFPRLAVLLALLAVDPRLVARHAPRTGFMPEMDEGAFVLDYNMPVGTSLSQTDKVLRRVETVLLETPDVQGYIRRTGAELGFFATESFTGDILVSLKPSGQRRPMDEIFDALREELKASVPELETEFVPLVHGSDRRPGGRRGADRGQGLRAGTGDAARACGQSGRNRREGRRRRRRQHARSPGQPRYRGPSRQRSDRAALASPSSTSRASSTPPSTARWPARSPSRTG